MTALRLLLILALTAPLLQCAHAGGRSAEDGPVGPVVITSVEGGFDEVWEGLETALSERGLTVSSVSHVGEMLERTGRALGRTKRIYGRAKVMEFCSALLSREMLETEPHFIVFCPYQIAVYTLAGDDRRVYLSYRRPIWKDDSGRKVLSAVERLLQGLVNDVVEMQREFR